jgi:predicted nucleic acid-binding protein
MISLVNEFSAILDTCTVLPISLCDLLLRIAEDPAMYKPRWSQGILEEIQRNLMGPRFNLSAEKAHYRIACMESAFPEALITGYEPLIEIMPNNHKDRHVLAAAVYGRVDAVITVDKTGFPDEHLQQFGIERLTPDEFLVHQWHLDPLLVRCRLLAQVADYKKSLDVHLNLLVRMTPKFVALVRDCNSHMEDTNEE